LLLKKQGNFSNIAADPVAPNESAN